MGLGSTSAAGWREFSLLVWVLSCSTAPALSKRSRRRRSRSRIRSTPECVTGSDQHPELVLYEPEANLCQISRLAHAIDTTEGDHVGTLVLPRLLHVTEDVHLGSRKVGGK